ncbi:hypothetical protein D9C73_011271 [Collichthys lucidus]|uniref:Uncharacterized protein n=1 Tax=Collichthys lucidus TaxID=240159 RepID=A0A4U5URR7_COLLU|nr:hypothetical protein D9C73_011271 [Collichthys lucidus]
MHVTHDERRTHIRHIPEAKCLTVVAPYGHQGADRDPTTGPVTRFRAVVFMLHSQTHKSHVSVGGGQRHGNTFDHKVNIPDTEPLKTENRFLQIPHDFNFNRINVRLDYKSKLMRSLRCIIAAFLFE